MGELFEIGELNVDIFGVITIKLTMSHTSECWLRTSRFSRLFIVISISTPTHFKSLFLMFHNSILHFPMNQQFKRRSGNRTLYT